MKTHFSLRKVLVVAALSVACLQLASPPEASAQVGRNLSVRVAELEQLTTNDVVNLSSNTAVQKIDFSIEKPIYHVVNLNTALTLHLTNVVAGREVELYVNTDGTARNVTITTNGSPSLNIAWDFTPNTNGATSFTATNKLRAVLKATQTTSSLITVNARYMWQR